LILGLIVSLAHVVPEAHHRYTTSDRSPG
jgi:hypothetical protein